MTATLSGAVGAVSTDLQIATAATNHNTRHPMVTAAWATTLHRLSGGRFALGFGRGVLPVAGQAHDLRMRDKMDAKTGEMGGCPMGHGQEGGVRALLGRTNIYVGDVLLQNSIGIQGTHPFGLREAWLVGAHIAPWEGGNRVQVWTDNGKNLLAMKGKRSASPRSMPRLRRRSSRSNCRSRRVNCDRT